MIYHIDDSKRLLHGGGWGDQPYWLIEAIDIYKVEIAKEMERKKSG